MITEVEPVEEPHQPAGRALRRLRGDLRQAIFWTTTGLCLVVRLPWPMTKSVKAEWDADDAAAVQSGRGLYGIRLSADADTGPGYRQGVEAECAKYLAEADPWEALRAAGAHRQGPGRSPAERTVKTVTTTTTPPSQPPASLLQDFGQEVTLLGR